ncbi:phosphate butyryltransferase [Desertibacillus haloalkaliphilus]|uniref:phosphate butyryltransferase n=1 Tax=Desertibacillus haloalkaliphilus TaxID=1328930 RepID=UPI001C275983|nr:phosphate butyryltransferase [Desertibacillus haloalkaliphilus]MBU8907751.1 phosphate butyryltransferase [Desertibacillus haloalkaliphilus]
MKLDDLVLEAAQLPQKTIAVAAADDDKVLEVIEEALKRKLASFLLFGKEQRIKSLLDDPSVVNDDVEIIDTTGPEQSAHLAVKAVHEGKADLVMKGMVSTSVILKAVLNKDYGLRTGRILSHVAVFEIPFFDRFLFITDSAMNVSPSLEQKVDIVINAVEVAHKIGYPVPKVAPITAVEVVNPDMAATMDAAVLTQMNRRGQIKNCLIDGPLALDNAISFEAARYKGLESDVAGRADILLVPTVEVGNILYKSLVYFANASVGGFIAGAKAPIILTSRTDSTNNKLYSIAMALHSLKSETEAQNNYLVSH